MSPLAEGAALLPALTGDPQSAGGSLSGLYGIDVAAGLGGWSSGKQVHDADVATAIVLDDRLMGHLEDLYLSVRDSVLTYLYSSETSPSDPSLASLWCEPFEQTAWSRGVVAYAYLSIPDDDYLGAIAPESLGAAWIDAHSYALQACRRSDVLIAARAEERAVLKLASHLQASFRTEQEWVGRVDSLEGEYFRATIKGRTDSPSQEAVTEIKVGMLSPHERRFLAPGAVFYWVLGVQDDADGSRSYVSRIRFRRLPPVDPETIKQSRARGSSMRERLNGNSAERT